MDQQGISTKMLESKEYKDSHDAMLYILSLLKNHIEIAEDIVSKNNTLRIKGYEQYRTYAQNKRKDKLTCIPCNPAGVHKLAALRLEIEKFFMWEREHRNEPRR